MTCSSALKSQLFSASVTLAILEAKGKIGDRLLISQWLRDLQIEVWEKNVWIKLAKNVLRPVKGFSFFLSFKDYLKYAIDQAILKALEITATEIRSNCFLVTSRQDFSKKYKVYINARQVRCECMRYRMLSNRVASELPYLYELIKEDSYLAGQLPCHHAVAAIGFGSFKDLFDDNQRIIEAGKRAKADLFPPPTPSAKSWGSLAIDVKPPIQNDDSYYDEIPF